jgi:hypothetical protein
LVVVLIAAVTLLTAPTGFAQDKGKSLESLLAEIKAAAGKSPSGRDLFTYEPAGAGRGPVFNVSVGSLEQGREVFTSFTIAERSFGENYKYKDGTLAKHAYVYSIAKSLPKGFKASPEMLKKLAELNDKNIEMGNVGLLENQDGSAAITFNYGFYIRPTDGETGWLIFKSMTWDIRTVAKELEPFVER